MTYTPVEKVDVGLTFLDEIIPVGALALHDHTIYFEYLPTFINQALEISPFHLPLRTGLQKINADSFEEGLPGVFYDSLPDGWGRLLLDRAARSHGILPNELTVLDRLCFVGTQGMGALNYQPSNKDFLIHEGELKLDELAKQMQIILQGESSDIIDELLILNGSSAGARPKAMIGLNQSKNNIIHGVNPLPEGYEHWLVKFPNSIESTDAGAIEFTYAQMAKLAGVEMMETALLPAKKSPGYFATKRFDRRESERSHVHSACGLLHSNFRTPSLDYAELIKATQLLTKDKSESLKVFRLAVFNVLAHNRDDHSKNFSFLMDKQGQWRFSPAYDLTFSSGPGGEQSTMVLGKGKNITHEDLINLGISTNIDKKSIKTTINDVTHAIAQWKKLAKKSGVSTDNIQWIGEQLAK